MNADRCRMCPHHDWFARGTLSERIICLANKRKSAAYVSEEECKFKERAE